MSVVFPSPPSPWISVTFGPESSAENDPFARRKLLALDKAYRDQLRERAFAVVCVVALARPLLRLGARHHAGDFRQPALTARLIDVAKLGDRIA